MLRLRVLGLVVLSFVSLSLAARGDDAKPQRPADQFFDSDGVKIHYIEQGEGEPVLLIHGFTANIQLQWVGPGVFPKLAKEFRVIALDSQEAEVACGRGHGLPPT